MSKSKTLPVALPSIRVTSGRIIEALGEASGMQMYATEPSGGMGEAEPEIDSAGAPVGGFDENRFEKEFDDFLNERFHMADYQTLKALNEYLERYVQQSKFTLPDLPDAPEAEGGMGPREPEPVGGMGSGGM